MKSRKESLKRTGRYLLSLAISVLVAFVIGAIIMLVAGFNPLKAYSAMFVGAFGSLRHVGDFLEYAMVLCLCAEACILGARVGIFNVGGEGQLILGAVFAAQVGVWMQGCPKALVLICAALTAMVIGGLYAFLPGILKVKVKVNEVITTIMLNSIAVFICAFLSKGPWQSNMPNVVAATQQLDKGYWLSPLIPGSKLSTAIFGAIIMTFLVWYIMSKTYKGFEMKLTGQNPRFSRFMGLKTDRMIIICMVISGMMCGLVGMFRVYGAEHAYQGSISQDYYFEGLTIAMIAAYRPLPAIGLSVFFAILKIGADALLFLNPRVPIQIYQIIQTIVIFCMAAQSGISAIFQARRQKKRAHAAAAARLEGGGENG